MLVISSSQNQTIKEIKSLKSRKGREENCLFVVEGLRISREAIAEKAGIKYLVMSESFIGAEDACMLKAEIESAEIKYYIVIDKLFKEIADTENPQGVLAVIGMNQPSLDEADLKESLIIMLDSVRDPGNMGTIIRTADAAGFSGVILTKGCVDVYNPKVIRSTMGSIFHIPVYQCADTADAIDLLKSRGVTVYVSHLEGSQSIYDSVLAAPLALVIGSEAKGVSRETALKADRLVRIPMPGRAESLNASVAASIMIYEAVRRKQ
jgi:TrmH family RNA methyltransferase